MKTVKMTGEFRYELSTTEARTLPEGWIGEVTEELFKRIRKAKAGEELKLPEPQAEGGDDKTEKAPEGGDTVQSGAGNDTTGGGSSTDTAGGASSTSGAAK